MALEGHILHLSNQHKKIQDIIESEMANPDWDEMRVAALKKQKLRIKDELERLRAEPHLPFKVTIVTNRGPETRAVAAVSRAVGAADFRSDDLPYEWPRGVFSLGHVALPFPPDDPVYGLDGAPDDAQPRFNIGAVAARGENGALVVSLATFARLRSNPFFEVIRAKVRETLRADEATAATRPPAP